MLTRLYLSRTSQAITETISSQTSTSAQSISFKDEPTAVKNEIVIKVL